MRISPSFTVAVTSVFLAAVVLIPNQHWFLPVSTGDVLERWTLIGDDLNDVILNATCHCAVAEHKDLVMLFAPFRALWGGRCGTNSWSGGLAWPCAVLNFTDIRANDRKADPRTNVMPIIN